MIKQTIYIYGEIQCVIHKPVHNKTYRTYIYTYNNLYAYNLIHVDTMSMYICILYKYSVIVNINASKTFKHFCIKSTHYNLWMHTYTCVQRKEYTFNK